MTESDKDNAGIGWQEGVVALLFDEIQDVERLKHGAASSDQQKFTDRAEALRWAEHLAHTYTDRAEYIGRLSVERLGFFDRARCGKYRGSAFSTTAWAIDWVLEQMGEPSMDGEVSA